LNEHQTNILEHQKIVACRPVAERNLQQVLTEYRDIHVVTVHHDAKLTDLRSKQSVATGNAQSCTIRGKALNQQITKMQTMGEGNCSQCGQLVTAEHRAMEIAKLETERDQLREEYAKFDREVSAINSQIAEVEADRNEQIRLHHEADRENQRIAEEAKQHIRQIEQSEAYLKQAQEYVDHLRQTMETARTHINPWRERENKAQQEIQALQHQREQLAQEDKESQDRLRHIDFWVTAFGPKGLKNYILDTKLQEMTDAANQWVQLLTGGTIWVRFETQKQTRSTKKLKNNLNIRVFRYNPDGTISERNYRSWSGGEKQRVSLAIDFGLSRLIAKRSRKQYDVLILDELFRHLDDAGKEAVVEMLQHLRREKSSVIVVEHDDMLRGSFENQILVRKKNGESEILGENHGEAESKPEKTVHRVPARFPVSKESDQSAYHGG
jgi:DNA repair exonuclease SbcCD ATPase subunit